MYVWRDKFVHDRLARLKQLFCERLKEFVFIDCFPLDKETSATSQFCKDRKDSSSIPLQKGMCMRKISKNLTCMCADIFFVLTPP